MLGGVLMAREWASLTMSGSKAFGWALGAVVVALVVWALLAAPDIVNSFAGLLSIAAIGAALVRSTSMKNIGWWLIGLAYVGMPMIAMWWLRTLDSGLVVLWVFLIVWATDIGGYFFGKGIGGPKLAPRISPKKTWAGLLGGMAFSVVVGFALHSLFSLGPVALVVVLASGALAIWAQAGDLLESGIKRHFGAKDSGELIPGHGGLLDRVDGLVFVAPAMALILFWFPTLQIVG